MPSTRAGSMIRASAAWAVLPKSSSRVVPRCDTTMALCPRPPGDDALPVPRKRSSTVALLAGRLRVGAREVEAREPEREEQAERAEDRHRDEDGVEAARQERARLVSQRAEGGMRGRIEERAELLRTWREHRR